MTAYNLTVPMKKIHPDAQPPLCGSRYALAYDLACVPDDTFLWDGETSKWYRRLMPMESHLFHTGWSFAPPKDFGVIFKDRSGMGGKRGIHHMAGICDADFLGEYLVKLINLSQEAQRIDDGDRIIQMIFIKRSDVKFVECDDLPATERGCCGFGSTGI